MSSHRYVLRDAFYIWFDREHTRYAGVHYMQEICKQLLASAMDRFIHRHTRQKLLDHRPICWQDMRYIVRMADVIDIVHMEIDPRVIAALQGRIDRMTIHTIDVDAQRHLLMLMHVGDYGRMIQLLMHCVQTGTSIDPWTVDIVKTWFQIVDSRNVVVQQLIRWLDNGSIRQSWQGVINTMAMEPSMACLLSDTNGGDLLYKMRSANKKVLDELGKLRDSTVFYTLHPMIKLAIRVYFGAQSEITGHHWVHWTSRSKILEEYKRLV